MIRFAAWAMMVGAEELKPKGRDVKLRALSCVTRMAGQTLGMPRRINAAQIYR